MEQVNVLDHGSVRLVESMCTDLSIVRSARVSHDAAWRTGEDADKDERLIHYLMKHRHTSPFESVIFTFEVKAPIFIFRQWHRHRTWSFNEVSARYSELPAEWYVPALDKIGAQSNSNKQARELEGSGNTTEAQSSRFSTWQRYRYACRQSHDAYQGLLQAGWPRELARGVLPVSTYSKMFATVDLHNLFHFLKLRLHEHAQYEIRVYAEAILALIQPIVPLAAAAWREHSLEIPQEV